MTTIASALGAAGNTPSSAPAVQPSGSTAAATTDFMQLLAKIVGAPAQQAITPLPPAVPGMLPQTDDPSGLEEGEIPMESLGMLALSLPALTVDPKHITAAGRFEASGAGQIGASASMQVLAGDAQVISEMIEAELALSRESADGPDAFQLHTTQAGQSLAKLGSTDALSRPVQAPVGSSQWADEIGTRLTMMTEQGKQAASLRLSPEHLGPLEIRITIKDDQTSVWFGAAHADTRAAIENALPRLRELFEAQGMSLADAGVHHGTAREQAGENHGVHAADLASGSVEEPLTSVRVNLGLVDAYA